MAIAIKMNIIVDDDISMYSVTPWTNMFFPPQANWIYRLYCEIAYKHESRYEFRRVMSNIEHG